MNVNWPNYNISRFCWFFGSQFPSKQLLLGGPRSCVFGRYSWGLDCKAWIGLLGRILGTFCATEMGSMFFQILKVAASWDTQSNVCKVTFFWENCDVLKWTWTTSEWTPLKRKDMAKHVLISHLMLTSSSNFDASFRLVNYAFELPD